MKSDDKEIHNKNRNNLLWIGFFIILIILHLPFVLILAYIVPRVTITDTLFYMMKLSPIFFSLATVDFIAFMSFIKKTPPWKACFILLLIFNILFCSEATYEMSQYMGDMMAIVVVPLSLLLAIIDLIAVLSYIITQWPKGKARFI